MSDWVRVPVEPSPAMIAEACKVEFEGYPLWVRLADAELTSEICVAFYRAMLAACPAAQEDDEIVMPTPPTKHGVGHVVSKGERPPLQFESDASEDVDAQDARRYRWLRDKASRALLKSKKREGQIQVIRWTDREAADVLWLEALDAAIDAAIAETGRGE